MASWRGIEFDTTRVSSQVGRRFALHEYPGRDLPWVEGLGKAVEKVLFEGFLNGGGVFDLRDRMIKACNVAGVGDLVHLTRGKVQACCVGSTLGDAVEGAGSVVMSLEFVLSEPASPKSLTPIQAASTQDDIFAGAGVADDGGNIYVLADVAVPMPLA